MRAWVSWVGGREAVAECEEKRIGRGLLCAARLEHVKVQGLVALFEAAHEGKEVFSE